MKDAVALRGKLARACSRALVVALPAAGSIAAQGEPVRRHYDLRALSATATELTDPPVALGFVDEAYQFERWHEWVAELEEGHAPTGGREWKALLERFAGQGSLLEVECSGGRLSIRARPDAHRAVERAVRALEAHALREVELEVFALEPLDVPPGARAVLGAAEAKALLAGARRLDHARGLARATQPLLLGATAGEAFLLDVDIESSLYSAGADPWIGTVEHGMQVRATARGLEHGRLLLLVEGRRGRRLEPTRELPLAAHGGTALQQLRGASVVALASASIEDGGALLVGADREDAGLLLVRARRTGWPAREDLPLVAAGSLTQPRRRGFAPVLLGARPSGAFPEDDPYVRASWEWPDERAVLEALGLPAGALRFEDELCAPGDEAALRAAREQVAALTAALDGTVAVELRVGPVDRAQVDLPASELAEVLAGDPGARVLGATRLGEGLSVLASVEEGYLADHDVEIGGGASGPDPIVLASAEGLGLWCLPARAPGGALALWIDVALFEAEGLAEQRVAFLRAPDGVVAAGPFEESGLVQLPRSRGAHLRAALVARSGEWTRVGAVQLPGRRAPVAAVLRAELLSAGGGR